jgi:hypothetical protein
MGWTIGVLGFDSRRWLGIFLFTTASGTALGPTQSPIQWVQRALSLRVKSSGRKADHSPGAEVKEWVELYIHTPNTPSWRGPQLKEAQGQLYLYLYFYLTLFIWSVHPKCLAAHYRQTRCPSSRRIEDMRFFPNLHPVFETVLVFFVL